MINIITPKDVSNATMSTSACRYWHVAKNSGQYEASGSQISRQKNVVFRSIIKQTFLVANCNLDVTRMLFTSQKLLITISNVKSRYSII